jgi:hypothetical protein
MEGDQLFKNDPLDPELAKVADRFIELTKEKKSVKDRFDIQAKNLTGLLKKAGKPRIRHAGVVIEIVHKDEADTVKLKAEKGTRMKKGKRARRR